MTVFQLLRTPLIGETPFAIRTNAHPGSGADCRAPYYVAQFGIGRNKKSGTFH